METLVPGPRQAREWSEQSDLRKSFLQLFLEEGKRGQIDRVALPSVRVSQK